MNLNELSAKELKVYATEQGIPFETNYGQKKMLDVIMGNGQLDPVETTDHTLNEPAHQAQIQITMNEWRATVKAFLSTPGITTLDQKKALRSQFLKKTKGIKATLLDLDAADELISVFRFEKERAMLPVNHEYKLNELESVQCEASCKCLKEPKAAGLFLQTGKIYPYRHAFSEEKQCNVYTIFVDRTIEPEEQIGKDLEWKIKQGFMPEQSDYPAEKVQVRRLILIEREFSRYFEDATESAEVMF